MSKRWGVFLILGLLVLSMSFTSASWFSDVWNKITGNTITGNAIITDNGIWLKANLHAHSTFSCPNRNDDGKDSSMEMMNKYKDNGYDVIALTPHFCIYPGTNCPSGMICIPAEESSSYGDPVNRDILRINPSASKSWSYRDGGVTNNEIKEACTSVENSFSIVAHPSSGYNNWTQNHLDFCYDNYQDVGYVEICNGGGITGWKGGYAEDLWAKQLKLGKKVFALGNDDAHSLDEVGICWNKINVPEISLNSAINSLKDGNSYVSTGPSMDLNPFKILCNGKNYLNMGQTGKCSNISISGTVEGESGKNITKVFLYIGDKKGNELKISLCTRSNHSCSFNYFENIEHDKYYRIVAEQEDTLVQFYSEGTRNKTLWSNPIWINSPKSTLVPLYRLYHRGVTDHLYTISEANKDYAISQGFEYQRIEAYVYTSQVEGTIPLYRLWRSGSHRYTATKQIRELAITEGFVNQGIEGYIYPVESGSKIESAIPLYGFYKGSITDYIYTAVENDRAYLESSGFMPQGIVGYVYSSIPSCTSLAYSPWTACNSSALQSRTITSSTPNGCAGGTPDALIQQCSPPCLESNWQSTDSTCLSSNTLTRAWTKIGNCDQTIGINKPSSETIFCNYIPNVITCTNFTYSNWSKCFSGGIQNRSLISSEPENCQAGNSILAQSCNYTALIVNQNITTNTNENQGDNSGDGSDDGEFYQNNTLDKTQENQSSKNGIWEKKAIKATEYHDTGSNILKRLFCRFFNLFREDKEC